MATYKEYDDGGTVIAASSGGNAAGAPVQTVLTGEFDSGKRGMVAADVAEVVTIPAGTLVKRVFVKILTPEAGQTINIGDGVDPDGYVAAGVASAVDTLMGAGALVVLTGAQLPGKYYAAEDTIDVQVPAAGVYTVLKVRIIVECTRVG